MWSIVEATILKDRITFMMRASAITQAHTARVLRAVTLTGSARNDEVDRRELTCW